MVVAQKEWIAIENPIKVEDLVVRQFQEKTSLQILSYWVDHVDQLITGRFFIARQIPIFNPFYCPL